MTIPSSSQLPQKLSRGAVALAAAIGLPACSPMQMVEAKTSETIVSNDTVNLPRQDAVSTFADKDGQVDVSVRTACDVYPRDRVRIEKDYEAHNLTPGRDWALGVGGVAAAGLGAWALVDAGKVYSTSSSSRTYNPYGPTTEVALGVAGIGLGATAIAVTVIDVVRSRREQRGVRYEDRRRSERVGTCDGGPAAGMNVALVFDKMRTPLTVPVGTTGADGRVHVNVGALAIPKKDACGLEEQPFGREAALTVNGREVGRIPLDPAYARWIATQRSRSAEVEAQAEANRDCSSIEACGPVVQYLNASVCYRNKRIATELHDHVDALAWSSAGVKRCSKSNDDDACQGVKAYEASVPKPLAHGDEADKLVENWTDRRRVQEERRLAALPHMQAIDFAGGCMALQALRQYGLDNGSVTGRPAAGEAFRVCDSNGDAIMQFSVVLGLGAFAAALQPGQGGQQEATRQLEEASRQPVVVDSSVKAVLQAAEHYSAAITQRQHQDKVRDCLREHPNFTQAGCEAVVGK